MDYRLSTKSQRYDRYAVRMQRLGRVVGFLRRHPVVCVLTALVLIGGIVAFLLSIGRFSGYAYCPAFYYGDTPQCQIRCFLSPVRYEYAQRDGEPVWLEGLPTKPGDYRIRLVSRGVFGKPRYSESIPAVMLPRPLTVELPTGSYVYGSFFEQKPEAKFANLLPTDTATAEYSTEEMSNGNYTISLKNLKISNESGEDVTGCYEISVTEGLFTMQKRPITVTAADAEKVYDGTPWNQPQASLTKGSLLQDDSLQIQFASTPVDAGSYPLSPQCTVVNGDGQDVTDRYEISILSGTLTIQPRPLWVATQSAEKVYDGTPLKQEDWSITDGTIVENHRLVAVVTGSQVDVGESPNTISLQIVDAQGNSVQENYQLLLSTGTLKVTPRPIKIHSDSAEKPYDGTPLTCHRYAVAEDAFQFGKKNQKIEKAYFTGTQTEVGSSANTFTVEIVDGNGIVTTTNYDITYVFGTLTVVESYEGSQGGSSQGGTGGGTTPNPDIEVTNLTLRALSATKVYDGKGFAGFDLSGYTIQSGALRAGHRLEVVCTVDKNPLTPGQYRNLITQCRIYDENGTDVTQTHYKIHTIAGTLTILHRKITVTIGSASKVYDGRVLTCSEYWVSEGSLLPPHELELTLDASIRDVGQVENTPSNLRIVAGGTDVTGCYEITVISGTLEITEAQ